MGCWSTEVNNLQDTFNDNLVFGNFWLDVFNIYFSLILFIVFFFVFLSMATDTKTTKKIKRKNSEQYFQKYVSWLLQPKRLFKSFTK